MNNLTRSFWTLAWMSLATGLIYPALVTGIGQVFFQEKTQGSLIWVEGKLRGSELLAQKSSESRWFWARPSAGDFATIPSGASQLAATNPKLQESIEAARSFWNTRMINPIRIQPEALMSSGSGLDADLSSEMVNEQVPGLCQARHFTEIQCEHLTRFVSAQRQNPQLGFLGRSRVNVNRLNSALEKGDYQ